TRPTVSRWIRARGPRRNSAFLAATRSARYLRRRQAMHTAFVTVLVAAAVFIPAAGLAQNATLRVGAAKVDITPAVDELPERYEGILDRLYSRAVVIEDGGTAAALVSVDAGGVPDAVWQSVATAVEGELGIPITNLLLTATHTHSAPPHPAGPYAQKIVES